MNEMNSLRFPFLGTCEDGETFEYLLENINQEKAVISTSNWIANHYTSLNLQEQVDLFIPAALTLAYQFRHNTPGIVGSIKKEKRDQTYFYEIFFEQQVPIAFSAYGPRELAQHLPAELSLMDLLKQLVKDMLILKQGVLVYLKHLAPYFSRIVEYSKQDYQSLENFIFDDVKNRIKANQESLHSLYSSLKEIKSLDDIPIILNLEYLRENIESEISLDLFLVAFANLGSREELMDLLRESRYQDKLKLRYFYMNYLISIKELEKKLYSNYNQIVLIYLKSI